LSLKKSLISHFYKLCLQAARFMDHQEFNPDWSAYYKAVAGRPPRNTLYAALERFETSTLAQQSHFAVDLGCGEGRDTVELLRRGWHVLAIDANPEGIEYLLSRQDLPQSDHLKTCVSNFEDADWYEADLVNASFSLPFCPPESFPNLWSQIVRSLHPGGRFAGQLFGNRDDWATIPGRSHHTRPEVEALFQSFEIEVFEEEEHDGQTALGQPKHWHLFHIVACKR
jgi:SAM-dependent methyltransferase